MRVPYDVAYRAMKETVIKVYQKYNGIINPSHPYTTMHILDTILPDNPDAYGNTSVFGKISISLFNILDFGKDEDPIERFVTKTAEITLHELSHCEQALDIYQLHFQNRLVRKQEAENEYRTGMFMLNRLDEMSNLLGYQIDADFIKTNYVDRYSDHKNFAYRNASTYPVYLNYVMLGDMTNIPRDCDVVTGIKEFGDLPVRRNGIYVPSHKLFEYYGEVYDNYWPMGWRFVTPNKIALIVKPR